MTVRFTHGAMHRLFPILLLVLAVSGCRHYNDDPIDIGTALQGTYVGSGNLGGGTVNIVLSVVGPDSLSRYSGAIRYDGAITDFSSVRVDSTQDSIHFEYTRRSTVYRLWSLTGPSGLVLNYTQPSGIASIRVNREMEGYNLSGVWGGAMSSSGLQIQNSAVMTMDQSGQLFTGTVRVVLFDTYNFVVQSGTLSRAAFQLNGTVRLSSVDYPGTFYGTFVSRDSVSGSWQVGNNASIDQGYFAFGRSFE
jgi:hypothetical protein